MDKIIEVKNVTKIFKNKGQQDVVSVNNISFDVYKGEIFGFLGRNGAGKSTTIKMITGQLIPTSGDIKVCDINPVKDEKKLAYKIGVVPELPNLYNDLNIRENLEFFAQLYGLPKTTADKFIVEFNLNEHLNKKTKELSKGLKQKVLIARALLHNPEVLFLDEPTSGLDPNSAVELKNLIKSLKNEGKTIFITTHNMSEVESLCDRVSIMKKGNILKLDTPRNLKLEYSSKKILIDAGEEQLEYSYEDFLKMLKFKYKDLKTIHSSEPNFEDVFIKIAGGED